MYWPSKAEYQAGARNPQTTVTTGAEKSSVTEKHGVNSSQRGWMSEVDVQTQSKDYTSRQLAVKSLTTTGRIELAAEEQRLKQDIAVLSSHTAGSAEIAASVDKVKANKEVQLAKVEQASKSRGIFGGRK